MMNDIFQDPDLRRSRLCLPRRYPDLHGDNGRHDRVTRLVLERLRQYKLYLRHDKCEFCQTKIEYLGPSSPMDRRR